MYFSLSQIGQQIELSYQDKLGIKVNILNKAYTQMIFSVLAVPVHTMLWGIFQRNVLDTGLCLCPCPVNPKEASLVR